MNDLRKAAEMALGALFETTALCENYKSVEEPDGYQFTEASDVIKQGNEAIAALRQALAQPEQNKRVCNTCNGTGIVKGLHNWAGGGKRTESCWACHEVAQPEQTCCCDEAIWKGEAAEECAAAIRAKGDKHD